MLWRLFLLGADGWLTMLATIKLSAQRTLSRKESGLVFYRVILSDIYQDSYAILAVMTIAATNQVDSHASNGAKSNQTREDVIEARDVQVSDKDTCIRDIGRARKNVGEVDGVDGDDVIVGVITN